jgi:GAF domain-containing protein
MNQAKSNIDFPAFFGLLLPDTPLTDVLQRVTQLACRTVANCEMAGITVEQHGKLETPVFTDARAPLIDQAQYDADTGPCVDAFRTGAILTIPDTAVDTRWPDFSRAATAASVRSTLSVPMDVSGNRTEVLGALNLYSEVPDAFDAEAVASAESLAQQAAIVVANAQAYWGAKELSEQLQQAMESRAVIEQAKGILMAQSHVPAEEAFQILVRASQRENRKLREIAVEIVQRTVRPSATATG